WGSSGCGGWGSSPTRALWSRSEREGWAESVFGAADSVPGERSGRERRGRPSRFFCARRLRDAQQLPRARARRARGRAGGARGRVGEGGALGDRLDTEGGSSGAQQKEWHHKRVSRIAGRRIRPRTTGV